MNNPTAKLRVQFRDLGNPTSTLWLDANQRWEDLQDELDEWIADAPEVGGWQIAGSEGFGDLHVTVWPLARIAFAAYLIEEHGEEVGHDALIGWLDVNRPEYLDEFDDDEAAAMKAFATEYLGDAECIEAWVQQSNEARDFLGLGDLQLAAQESDRAHDYGEGGNNTTALTALQRVVDYIDWGAVADALIQAGDFRTYVVSLSGVHVYGPPVV
jgi:hypothetical protein